MAAGEIKVSFPDIESALAEIKAIKDMVADTKNLELSIGQSKGAGAEALEESATAVKTAATAFESLCQRCYQTVQSTSEGYSETDTGLAEQNRGIGAYAQ